MDFTIGCTLTYTVKQPTPFVFNLEAAKFPRQVVKSETLVTMPRVAEPDRYAAPGSDSRMARLIIPVGRFQIDYQAEISLDPLMIDPTQVTELPAGALPMDVLTFLNASRYCQSDRLSRFANRQFGNEPTGHQRATAICNWIRDNVDYEPGTSGVLTSAYDTLGDRAGVCRDFAHLAIALCRVSEFRLATSAPMPGSCSRRTSTRCSRLTCMDRAAAPGICSTQPAWLPWTGWSASEPGETLRTWRSVRSMGRRNRSRRTCGSRGRHPGQSAPPRP